jgi:hypothetical protein
MRTGRGEARMRTNNWRIKDAEELESIHLGPYSPEQGL